MKQPKPQRARVGTVKVSDFATRLLSAWRALHLPVSNARLILAASGGADSTALLLALDELIRAKKLLLTVTVAHLDHGLRKASKDDALWLENLVGQLGFDWAKRRTDVKRRAAKTADNLEQAARRARYEYLKKTAKEKDSLLILTAHTLDDQAETILLRLLRGSAAEGLSGIEGVRRLDGNSSIELARPLLGWARRLDAETYCRKRKVEFRMDEMNEDEKFIRVKVRKQLLPLMKSFNNKIVEALARTSTLLREDAKALSEEAKKLLQLARGEASSKRRKTDVPPLNVQVLATAPAAVRKRALRLWISDGRGDLRRVEMVHLAAVDRLIEGKLSGRIAELPDGAQVVRRRGWLEFKSRQSREKS